MKRRVDGKKLQTIEESLEGIDSTLSIIGCGMMSVLTALAIILAFIVSKVF